MALHIDEYIKQTTLSSYPYIQKLNAAYIKSFIEASDYFKAVDYFCSRFSPDRNFFLFDELYPGISQFKEERIRTALAFAIQFKTLSALQVLVQACGLGTVTVAYGNAYGQSAPEETDQNPAVPDYTDENSYTDSIALPLYVIWLDYSEDSSIGIPLWEEALQNALLYAPLITSAKPARISVYNLGRKNLLFSSRKQVGGTQTSGPSFTTLESLPVSQLSALYHEVYVPGNVEWHEIYSNPTKRVFEIISAVPQTSISIRSGSTRPNLVFSVNSDSVWTDEMVSFRYRVCLNFSKDASTDNYDEVRYG